MDSLHRITSALTLYECKAIIPQTATSFEWMHVTKMPPAPILGVNLLQGELWPFFSSVFSANDKEIHSDAISYRNGIILSKQPSLVQECLSKVSALTCKHRSPWIADIKSTSHISQRNEFLMLIIPRSRLRVLCFSKLSASRLSNF